MEIHHKMLEVFAVVETPEGAEAEFITIANLIDTVGRNLERISKMKAATEDQRAACLAALECLPVPTSPDMEQFLAGMSGDPVPGPTLRVINGGISNA